MSHIPQITLNDGHSIAQLGFGVWQVSNEEVIPAIRTAIDVGYRSIDTAQGYGNEEGTGRAIAESGVPREELFITSKLRPKDQGFDATIDSFKASLKRLGLDYLDLFLIHWPAPGLDRYADSWKAFVQLQKDGLVRSIGVSNFLPEHLERVIGDTGVTPAVNQIELHPQFQQRDVRDFHAQHKIAIESYSPLGSGKGLLNNPVISEIAVKYGVTPAQAVLRWHLQQGLIVIPKSVHAERIRENFDVFGFQLDPVDMGKIDALDRPDGKIGSDPATNNSVW
ncbi:MAG: aldo/keto reductase [Candidatus Devosia phytovorans]|uniref:Aldo/keto reductase n=1 Tax=Candidatus Devosia phytovorans TaxID=3121372 RepID=A0AAJ5VXC8_9HYPH|nr:aldo/keto reductase [Devosia sp.]WEK05223.1 MAG: aldo/keto reductase [Devosia sp.]